MTSRLRPTLFWLLLAALPFSVAMQCGGTLVPRIEITSPLNGEFTTAGTVIVTGFYTVIDPSEAVATINGQPLTLNPDRSFSQAVTLSPTEIVNSIVVEVQSASFATERTRVTVFSGESIADGDFTLEGMAMRIAAAGLDEMEPVIGSLFVFDPATLIPLNTVLFDDCFVNVIFCLGSAQVSVVSPAPSISSFGIDAMPIPDAISGTVSIYDLDVNLFIDGTGVVPNCGLNLQATVTDIPGTYEVEPDAVTPNGVDVTQTAVGINFNGFQQNFTSGICDVPVIGDLIQLIIGDLEPLVTQGFVDFLADPDGPGPLDAPIADGIELAVSGLDLSGEIGSQIGVNLEAPHFAIDEDFDGLTIGTDARITASMPAPGAPDLLASYHVTDPFPTFGATTPTGSPYDLGLCISTSAFNQLLKAEIESGLLQQVLTEIDLGTGPIPVTAGFLATFVPELAVFDPADPMEVHLTPSLSPFVTGAAGPQAELAELQIPHLVVEIIDANSGAQLVQVAVDAKVGLDIGFAAGSLDIAIGALDPSSLNIDIIQNTLQTNEVVLSAVLGLVLTQAFPQLAGSLAGFPLPEFFGLQSSFIEASKNGEFLSIFLDLSAVP